MKRNLTDADMQFICPMCNEVLKQIDYKPFQTTGSYVLTPYGCVNCGYIASFETNRLEDFIQRRLNI